MNLLRREIRGRVLPDQRRVLLVPARNGSQPYLRASRVGVLAGDVIVQLAPGGKELALVGFDGLISQPRLLIRRNIRREAAERGQQSCGIRVLPDLCRQLLLHELRHDLGLRHPTLCRFVQQCEILIYISRNRTQTGEDGFVILYRAGRHAIDGNVDFVVAVLLAHAEKKLLGCFRGKLNSEIVLHEPRCQAVLRGELIQPKSCQLIETRLEMRVTLIAGCFGPVRPTVVVLVPADPCGTLRLIANHFLECIGKESSDVRGLGLRVSQTRENARTIHNRFIL